MAFNETQSDRYIGFEFYIDDTLYPLYNFLESFKLSMGEGHDWVATLVLFDPTWSTLNDLALKLYNTKSEISLRFGWNGRLSALYRVKMLAPNTELEHEGMTLTLNLGNAEASPSNYGTLTKSWEAGTKPSDVATYISDYLGFANKIIEESKPYNASPIIADKVHPIKWFMENFHGGRAKKPVTSLTGTSGYFFNIDTVGTFHFHTREYLSKVITREYIYARGQKGQVLSFQPSDNSLLWNMFIGGTTQAIGIDSKKKGTVVKTASYEKTPVNVTDGKRINKDMLDKKTSKRHVVVARDGGKIEADILNRWQSANKQIYAANLEILGDPFIALLDLISVRVIMPNGKTYPLSGTFNVTGIEHSLDSSGFTTSLTLNKEGLVTEGVEMPKAVSIQTEIKLEEPDEEPDEAREAQDIKEKDKKKKEITGRIKTTAEHKKAKALQVTRETDAKNAAVEVKKQLEIGTGERPPASIFASILASVSNAIQQVINGLLALARASQNAGNIGIAVINTEVGSLNQVTKDYAEKLFETYFYEIRMESFIKINGWYGVMDSAQKINTTNMLNSASHLGISGFINDLDIIFPGIPATVKNEVASIIELKVNNWISSTQILIENAYGISTKTAFINAITTTGVDGIDSILGALLASIKTPSENFLRGIISGYIAQGVSRAKTLLGI